MRMKPVAVQMNLVAMQMNLGTMRMNPVAYHPPVFFRRSGNSWGVDLDQIGASSWDA